MKTKLLLTLIAFAGINFTIMAQQLTTGAKFPEFTTTDVWGRPLSSTNNSGKTWWLFHRNVGCPGCNLRIHQIGLLADSLTKTGNRVIIVLESPAERIKEYLSAKPGNLIYVGDPDRKLYNLVGAEISFGKNLKGLFHGSLAMAKKGQKLMPKKVKQDGHLNTMPVEFVVNNAGQTELAYYAKYLGDEPEISDIAKIIGK